MSDNNLIQIGRFYDSTQAHIIKGKLETNDIPCFLFDNHLNGVAWHLNIATGGTRLMINQADLKLATEILQDDIELQDSNKSTSRPLVKKPYIKTVPMIVWGYMTGLIFKTLRRKD